MTEQEIKEREQIIKDSFSKRPVSWGEPIFDESLRYGYNEELDKLVDSTSVSDRLKAVDKWYGIEKLKDDKDSRVRLAIARQGHIFNSFITDSSPLVRLEVARRFPEKVKDDANFAVRREALNKLNSQN